MFTVAIIGTGNRGRTYGNILNKRKDVKIVSLCDLNKAIMLDRATKWRVDRDKCFVNEDDFWGQGKVADAIIIATQDRDHYGHAIKALNLGYNILLEKPVSPSLDECLQIQSLAKEKDLKVVVCHVLRYSAFYKTLRSVLVDGTIGDIVDINHTENVGYWHFSHSYVRGNWRRADETSPSILAKCCHDFDQIYWWTGQTCKQLYATGKRQYFVSANKPIDAPKYCLDGCKHTKVCPYHVSKIYYKITRHSLPLMLMNIKLITQQPKPTLKLLRQTLKTSPYGRCVFQCDNDVMETQNTSMVLSGGTTVKLSMNALSKKMFRDIRITGSKGEIKGIDAKGKFVVTIFGGATYTVNARHGKKAGAHLGGDAGLVNDFIDLLAYGKEYDGITYIDQTIESHRNALASEQSRLTGQVIKF